MTMAARNALFRLLCDETNLNLGLKFHPTTGNMIVTSDLYLKHDPRSVTFDACINQCILYEGVHATKIECPVCKTKRYTKCNYGGRCKFEPGCSPFEHPTHHYRASLQLLIYRSVVV